MHASPLLYHILLGKLAATEMRSQASLPSLDLFHLCFLLLFSVPIPVFSKRLKAEGCSLVWGPFRTVNLSSLI